MRGKMSFQPKATIPTPGRCNLLIVDDDPEMRSLLSEELEEEGYKVTVAKNGLDVLSDIPFTAYDLIITDWKLPLRDGIQILKSVREIHPNIPVILITAFGDSKIRKKVEKAGGVYLQKPFSMEAFKEMVQSLLLRGKQPDSA
jgi:DNA-binding response OmpR family regulator